LLSGSLACRKTRIDGCAFGFSLQLIRHRSGARLDERNDGRYGRATFESWSHYDGHRFTRDRLVELSEPVLRFSPAFVSSAMAELAPRQSNANALVSSL
jgi:hypothetical protein